MTGPGVETRKVLITLVVATAAYFFFPSFLQMMNYRLARDIGTTTTMFPMIIFAIGLSVGYRLPRHGWAYAAAPIILLNAVLLLTSPAEARHICLAYTLPVELLGSITGGFIGSKLVRPTEP